MKKERALVIINPKSGRIRVKSQLFNIADHFSQNGIETTVYTTSGRGDATDYARDLSENFDIVVARGGDGTLNEVLNGVMKAPVLKPIGYIPAGTTNDFAKTMNIPTDTKKAIELIINGDPHPQDIGILNEETYFMYTASFGLFTKASYATPQGYKNLFGYYAYLMEGAKELFNLKPIHMKLTCDGVEYEGDYILGAVTNSLSVGGILKYNEDLPDFNDGKFEILLAKKPPSVKDIAEMVLAARKGTFDERYITIFQGSEIICESEEEVPWTIDGEYGGKYTRSTLRCCQNAVEIFREILT